MLLLVASNPALVDSNYCRNKIPKLIPSIEIERWANTEPRRVEKAKENLILHGEESEDQSEVSRPMGGKSASRIAAGPKDHVSQFTIHLNDNLGLVPTGMTRTFGLSSMNADYAWLESPLATLHRSVVDVKAQVFVMRARSMIQSVRVDDCVK